MTLATINNQISYGNLHLSVPPLSPQATKNPQTRTSEQDSVRCLTKECDSSPTVNLSVRVCRLPDCLPLPPPARRHTPTTPIIEILAGNAPFGNSIPRCRIGLSLLARPRLAMMAAGYQLTIPLETELKKPIALLSFETWHWFTFYEGQFTLLHTCVRVCLFIRTRTRTRSPPYLSVESGTVYD